MTFVLMLVFAVSGVLLLLLLSLSGELSSDNSMTFGSPRIRRGSSSSESSESELSTILRDCGNFRVFVIAGDERGVHLSLP